jgi:Spy/CpxP family protein refolding chaperone
MKMTILTIIGTALVALTGLAFMDCDHSGAWHEDDVSWQAAREHRINFVKARLAERLELTESKQSELDRMIGELKDKGDAIRAHRAEFKAQFIDTPRQDHLEADDRLGLVDSKRPEFEELLALVAEKMAEFHNIPTPEQRAKLVSELESHGDRYPFGRRIVN